MFGSPIFRLLGLRRKLGERLYFREHAERRSLVRVD